jgi:23S rRNA (cytidine1920-2'-O)/16S rRNA (cytidine1409-2'-O)-methyltransferase
MRLDQGLVQRKLCESRTEAQELIEAGQVRLNGEEVHKKTRQISEIDVLTVLAKRQFVSRGGLKLQGAFKGIFNSEESILNFCIGKSALDVGASTGGFSDYLLSCGIGHVDAVDVGTAQIHQKIATDKKITVFENTNILTFKTASKYDIIVADLSFVKLSVVLKCLIELGKVGTLYLLLIKPQFEVGKGNTKKGIVKDFTLVESILEEYIVLGKEFGLQDVAISPSVLKGGDGNQEYFLTGTI